MNKRALLFFIMVVILLQSTYAQIQSINQFEETNSVNEFERATLDATVTLMQNVLLKPTGSVYNFEKRSLQDLGVCADQRFSDQLSLGFCSGILISSDTIITAAHCIEDKSGCKNTEKCNPDSSECKKINFVFGYENEMIESPEGLRALAPKNIPAENVYNCSEILFRQEEQELDIAIIKLTRPVTNRTPVRWRRSSKPSVDDRLYVVSSLEGVPLKISRGKVMHIPEDKYKDGYQGFYGASGAVSGAGVMNQKGHFLEGIHASAFKSYEVDKKRGCLKWVDRDVGRVKGESKYYESKNYRLVRGTRFIPVAYFREKLDRYVKKENGSSTGGSRSRDGAF